MRTFPTFWSLLFLCSAFLSQPASAQMTLTGAGSSCAGSCGGGGATTTLNPADKAGTVTLSAGNLVMTNSGVGSVRSITSHSSGKYYFEFVAGAGTATNYDHAVGAANSTASLTAGPGSPDVNSIAYYNGDPAIYAGGASAGSTGLTMAEGDTVGVAIDMDNSTMWVRLNGGNWNNSGTNNPATNTGGISISAVSKPWFVLGYAGANTRFNTFNLGATAYANSAPAGFGNF